MSRPATGAAPDWLTAQPIAHRGLHAKTRGVVENTLAAAEAAIVRGYAIECDIQLAGDGEAVVFHDFTLERLTLGQGRADALSARELGAVRFRDCGEMIPALPAYLARIGGRTPLVIEIKSRFDGDTRLAARALAVLSGYAGPAALKSFDPAVVAFLRAQGARLPLGLVAEAHYGVGQWPELSPGQRQELATLRDFARARPDFLSWSVADLPHAVPELCRNSLGLPVMTWTVRTPEQRACAALWADQMIFEGFEP